MKLRTAMGLILVAVAAGPAAAASFMIGDNDRYGMGTVATFTFTGLGNSWSAGHLEIDMADFRASTFGATAVTFNGIVQNWAYNDGLPNTVIQTRDLSAGILSSINSTGALTIVIDRNQLGDFYGFDYLKLNDYAVTAVPEPATLAPMLVGMGLMGTVARRRKENQS